jgi:hypothetical protein
MTTIDRTAIERILTLLSKKDITTLKSEDFDKFQYQGFDPFKIVQSLLEVKNQKNLSDADFENDVITMIAIGLIKGNVNSNNEKKMSDEGQSSLKDLKIRYAIRHGGGKGQPGKVITYPRVMATFPDVAVRMAIKLGPKDFPGGPFNSMRLPIYMRVQIFPAVIPKNLDPIAKEFLLLASLCYGVDQTVALRKLNVTDVKPIVSSQRSFIELSHRSPVATDESRITLFKELNGPQNYGKISSVLHDYARIFPEYTIPSEAEIRAAFVDL